MEKDNEIFLLTYRKLVKQLPGWDLIFDKYEFNGILAPSDHIWPLTSMLMTQKDWKTVYQDNISILLIKEPEK